LQRMMNPGEHRNPEPGSSGRLSLPAELSAQGSVTTPARRGESMSQAGRGSQITGSGTRCRRPKRAALSKERSQPSGGQYPAGQQSPWRSGARTLAKPRRGFGRASARAAARGNSFEVRKPRGQRPCRLAHPNRSGVRILAESKALKATCSVCLGSRVRLGSGTAEANATKGTRVGRF
jgi:hypothetical protein